MKNSHRDYHSLLPLKNYHQWSFYTDFYAVDNGREVLDSGIQRKKEVPRTQLEFGDRPGIILNYTARMKQQFTAVIKKDSGWWIGWIEEIPGVNSQGKTKPELMKNLRSALSEAVELNRADALKAAVDNYEEATILV